MAPQVKQKPGNSENISESKMNFAKKEVGAQKGLSTSRGAPPLLDTSIPKLWPAPRPPGQEGSWESTVIENQA